MNPYLLLKKPTGNSYYFTKIVLEEIKWPESPSSDIEPEIRVEILEEWPFGSYGPIPLYGRRVILQSNVASAVMGLFLGGQLMAKMLARKWLVLENHFFFYHYNNPRRGDRTVDKELSMGLPTVKPSDNENLRIESYSTLVSPSFLGSEEFRLDINDAIKKAYYRWNPTPPDTLEEATEGLIRTLTTDVNQPAGKAHKDMVTIDCGPASLSPQQYQQAYVSFGIWTDGGFLDDVKPIYAVGAVGRNVSDYGQLLFMDAEDAVRHAAAFCMTTGGTPSHVIDSKTDELRELVNERLEFLQNELEDGS